MGNSHNNTARLQEEYRLAAQVMRITNRLEECVSKLKNGFMDQGHFLETKATISRLHTETMDVALDVEEKLDTVNTQPRTEPDCSADGSTSPVQSSAADTGRRPSGSAGGASG